jgi:hypothetical protein
MLVIFYLQTENFMPSIKKMQKNVPKELINGKKFLLINCYLKSQFAGTEVQYDPNRKIFNYFCKKLRNYKAFVIDFFDFYSDFDFQQQFISVVDGRSYNFSRVADNPDMQKPMSVSSILENDVNAAKLVGYKKLDKFQRVCDEAADILIDCGF